MSQRVHRIYADSKEPKSYRTDTSLTQGAFGVFEDDVRSHLLSLDRRLEAQFLELDRKLDLIALQVNGGFDNLSLNLSKQCYVEESKQNGRTPSKHEFITGPSPRSAVAPSWKVEEDKSKDVTCIAINGHHAPNTTDGLPISEGEGGAPDVPRRRSLASNTSRSSLGGLSSWDLDFIRRSRPSRWKQSVWNVLEDPDSGCVARWYPRVWSILVVATSLLSLMQNVGTFPIKGVTLTGLELAVDLVFFTEFTVRFAVCRNSLVFVTGLHNVIDAIAALPLGFRIYILVSDQDLEGVAGTALICIVPLIRLLKVMRHVRQFYLFLRLLDETREALSVLLFLLTVIVISFSTLVYLVEPQDNVESLPKAMYLIIVTISTVGYGDVTPATTAGTFAVSAIIPCSVLYMAMPIGIVGNAFTRIWSDRDRILLTIKTRDRLKEWGYTAADTTRLLKHFDSNRNGELNLQEFRQMIAEMHLGIKDDRVVAMFDSFDKDGSGEIDPKEFTRMLFPSTFYEILDREEREKASTLPAPPPPATPMPPPLKKPSKELLGLTLRSKSKDKRTLAADAVLDQTDGSGGSSNDNGPMHDSAPTAPSQWRLMATGAD